ncbi:hypothetical protein POKO110462_02505 [Pontibacter korlensis]|uniref:STAS/SEC14 domain-containing protein n=1 Tax=Pontibacter korlensis TaxID=400092 RepID=A0A0E3UWT8_9BACT|nr:hypothetical protein [Pontibacter korlensis]AKD03662.1 hypothetical protein PKOR_11650 [Pontibacter korlensis]
MEIASEEVFQNSFVRVLYNKAASLLIIKWTRQIDLEERKEGFSWALDFSISQSVKYWLIDDEEIFIITSQEQEWVEGPWTELVATSGILKIAVCLQDHYNSLATLTDFTRRAKDNYLRHGVTQHEVFMDVQTALEWLLTKEE